MTEDPKPVQKLSYGTHYGNVRTIAELLRDQDDKSWHANMPQQPEHHRYVVWLGCSVTRTAHIADTLSDILRHLGADFVALGGPSHCCGILHNSQGDTAIAENMLRTTAKKFDTFTPEKLLNWCPSCNSELKRLPDSELSDVARDRGSVSTFLADNADRFRFVCDVPMKVAIHSHGGTSEEDRDSVAIRAILAKIPGLEVVELPIEMTFQRHCSDQNVRKHGKAMFLDKLQVWTQTAKREGATHIVTPYHSCHRQILLTQMGLEVEERIDVVNYLTLIARGLGLPERDDTFARFARSGDVDAMMEELAPRIKAQNMDPERARRSLVAHFGHAKG